MHQFIFDENTEAYKLIPFVYVAVPTLVFSYVRYVAGFIYGNGHNVPGH